MTAAPLSKEDVLKLLGSVVPERESADVGIFGTELSAQQAAYLQAAAVLSYFSPPDLRPAGGTASDPAAMSVLLSNARQATADAQGKPRWILNSTPRTEILRRMGSPDALRAALEANPQRSSDPLQRMLDTFIRGQPFSVEALTQEELAAALQILEWLGPVLPNLPSAADVRAAYAWAELLAPFRYLAGITFVGRTAELKQLGDYALGAQGPRINQGAFAPLLIYAAGGMGKSTLLSKFILDHNLNLAPSDHLAFVYLDFDRPGLLPEEPLTLLAEAVGQLAAQFGDRGGRAAELRTDMLRSLADSRQYPNSYETSGGTRGVKQARAVDKRPMTSSYKDRPYFIDRFVKHCEGELLARRPMLFVLDTFEEVQYLSQDFVNATWEFLGELSSRLPLFRPVLAGRAMIAGRSRGNRPLLVQPLPLGPLDNEAAIQYLATSGITDRAVAQTVVNLVQGNVLSLKLAAAALKTQDAEAPDLPGLAAYLGEKGVAENLIQGQLYKRVLSHVHNPEVRALAHPGLVLRRVTPELILRVLAGPCNIPVPDMAAAQALFDEMAREVSLVTVDEDGSLVHRPDIRRLMLDLLRQDEPLKVLEIDKLAAEYYASQSGPKNRAEEIYHLLQRGAKPDEVDARWMDEAAPFLRNALDELPPDVRPYLAARLGITAGAFNWDEARVEDWERYAEQRARDLMSLGKSEEALAALAERKERSAHSPLYRLEAQILEQLGRWPEARRAAKEGILQATRAHDDELLLDLFLVAARMDEKLGHYAQAEQMLSSIKGLQIKLDDASRQMLDFEVGVQRLRLKRLAPAFVPDELDALRQAAMQQFESVLYTGLRQRPDLVLSLVEEVGAAEPKVLERVLALAHGVEAPDDAEANALASALVAWDAAQGGGVAKAAGLTVGPDPTASWTGFICAQQPGALISELQSLAYLFTPTPDVVRTIVQILRTKPAPASDARLSNELFNDLRTTLFVCFPEKQALAELVKGALHEDLDQIAGAEFYTDVLYNLVVWAENYGRTVDLLQAALAQAGDAGETRDKLAALLARVQPGQVAPALPADDQPAVAKDLGPINAPETPPPAPGMEPPPGMIRTGPGSFVRPEMVFAWAERMREVSREICRVETGQGMATGFLISPNLVMTAAQVLPESQKDSAGARPDAMRFRFDYQYERDGVTLRQPSIYSLAEDWLVDYERGSEDGYHFALLRLDGTPGSDLAPGQDKRRGWLQAAPADQLRAGDPVLTLGHYQAEPLRMECLYAETLPGGKGNLLVLTSASGIRGPGASGGPCCDSLWRVVGLRFASSFPTGVTPGSGDNAVLRVQCSGIHAILSRPKVAAALEASLKGAGSAS